MLIVAVATAAVIIRPAIFPPRRVSCPANRTNWRTRGSLIIPHLEFAFSFVDGMGSNFLDPELVSQENRLRCKNLVFPAGFYLDENSKVYTPEISLLYRLATKKKDAEASEDSFGAA